MALVKANDLMSGKLPTVRFAVGRIDACSLTFGVLRQKNEAYLYCREFKDFKLSLHSSGRHRLATISEEPRPAIFQTKQLNLRKRTYSTFCRVIFTVDTDWSSIPTVLKRPKVLLPIFPQTSLGMISIGFLSHHPNQYFETSMSANCAFIKIESKKYIVLTRQTMTLSKFKEYSYHHAAINPHYEPQIRTQENSEGSFDHIALLMTNWNTYILWAHHGTPTADQGWLANHQATQEMFQARDDQLSGTFTGRSLEQEMDARYAGWREEYCAKFGDPPQMPIVT